MKLLLLSDANSIHTQKWVESLYHKGLKIKLFSFIKPHKHIQNNYKKMNINVLSSDLNSKIKNLRQPNLSKMRYLKSIPILKKTIKSFKPNILHAHYASSYGVIGSLIGFKPFILSVWGSDVYYFPKKNLLNSFILKQVIKSADIICSTSNPMKKLIINNYGRSDIETIPFGIDTKFFKPISKTKSKFTVGTIKSIEDHNGIDCFIDAAKILLVDHRKDFDFLIIGDGSLKTKMEKRVKDLGLSDKIKFLGFIEHKNVLSYFNMLSVFVAVSLRESFGVSVLEAAACEVPSVTSNVGGLIEVNKHNQTGIVISPENPQKLAESILKLYKNENFRLKLGLEARRRVIKDFNWKDNVNKMLNIYNNI